MGLESIDSLRNELPDLFKDRMVLEEFEDDWVIIPTDLIDGIEDEFAEILGELFDGYTFDAQDTVAPTESPDWGDKFPGSPVWVTPSGVPSSSPPPPPDAMAFYLPFHYFHPKWWGIYLVWEWVIYLAKWIQGRSGCTAIPLRDLIRISKIYLYRHEFFHHKSEVWATRTEIVDRNPLFTGPYEKEYRRRLGTDDCTEEAVANAYAYDEVKKAIKKPDFNFTSHQRQCVLDALEEHIRVSGPGYRMARHMLSLAKMKNGERQLAEEYWQSAFGPRPKLSEDAWKVFSHAFSGITNKLSRTNYIVRRGSSLHHRLGLNGRLLSLKEIKKTLTGLGCYKVRDGSGHEIWRCPNGGQTELPRHRGDIAKGTLSAILRQLKLDLSITQFQQVR